MPDDKSKREFRDRNRVSADVEVGYFAELNGIKLDDVTELFRKVGNKDEDSVAEAKVRERS